MKILHLSDTPLPDWRIQKSASSSKKRGLDVYFGGPNVLGCKTEFTQLYEISWTSRARNKLPFYWNMVKKQMSKAINELRPDIIHAHNIFSAKMAGEICDLPLVYDDHEYWSMYNKIKIEAYNNFEKTRGRKSLSTKGSARKLANCILNTRFELIWSKVENDLILNNPTITVSESILNELSRIGKKIFLVPNFPTCSEVENIREPVFHENLSSVYAGIELNNPIKLLHMDLGDFFNLFEMHDMGMLYVLGWNRISTRNVIYRGYLDRNQMYNEMFDNSIGLIPFKKHWFHPYSSPNKAYEYAHAGLLVMLTSDLRSVAENLGEHCILFDDHHDLVNKLNDVKANMDDLYSKRLRSYQYARNNLLWDKFEKNIFESYKVC
jgi:glycosyltransferase involved in cell wall biosynthesis